MRILILHNKYKNLGGEDIAVDNEFNFLRKFHDVELLYFENNFKSYIFDILGLISGKNLKSIKLLDKKITSFQPDIVYVHNTWFKVSTGVFNYLKLNNLNTVLKIHNFRYFCTRSFKSSIHFSNNDMCPACGLLKKDMGYFNRYFRESFIKSVYVCIYGKRYLNIIKNFGLKIVVLTDFHKQFLKNLGLNENKLFVIPNFLEVDKVEEGSNVKQKEIIYAGRISAEKGIKELIESFINSDLVGYKLKIIGEGPLLTEFKERYENEKIIFTGHLSNEETIKNIKNASCVVTATKLYEGQPNLLSEASLLEIPSIFPNSGGIKEFFPNDSKLMFEQYNYPDLVLKLQELNNPELLKVEGRKNYIYIKNLLDKEKIITQFNNLIEDFVI